MSSVVSLRNLTNASGVPIVVFGDMQREYRAAPRVLAIPGIERAFENCRNVLDLAGRIGSPAAFVHAPAKSAFFNFNRAPPRASHARAGVSVDRTHHAVSKISGLSADIDQTDDWIASTLSRTLGIGKNAGG